MKRFAAWPACMFALVTLQYAHANNLNVTDFTGESYALHVTSLKEARFKRTIHQQYDFSCGSAAVATLLTYQYDYPVNEQAAFVEMFRNGNQAKIRREGFSLLDIKRFLEARGFDADGFEVPLEKLAQTNTPAIVLINERGYHHFVVVKGIENSRVLVGDPATGTRPIPQKTFEEQWQDHLVFVIHNRHEEAHFNDPRDWRVAPNAPLFTGIDRSGLYDVVVPKHGPGDF
jgi:uncharacterized protein